MLWGDGFEIETVLNCRVAAAGLKIVEVPSVERRRIYGQSNLRTFADGARVLRTLVAELRRAERMNHQPLASARARRSFPVSRASLPLPETDRIGVRYATEGEAS